MMFISGKEHLSARDEIKYIAYLFGYPFNLVVKKNNERLEDYMIDCENELNIFKFNHSQYTITFDRYRHRIVYEFKE